MRLTPPLPLLPHSWTQADIDEIAHVVRSTANSSAIAELRYGTVPPDEAKEYFKAVVRTEMGEWSEKGTIREGEGVRAGVDKTPAGEGDRRGEADRYEVLVVRDLDWPRQHDQQQQNSNIAPEGTIVAYCVHRYNGARDHLDSPTAPAESHSAHPPPPSFPKSGNAPLHTYFNTIVEKALDLTFRTHPGLPTYEVLELCTLSPSYLRKGIAKGLVEWVFGPADRDQVPMVLAGSPVGVGVYRKVGFVEVEPGPGKGIVQGNKEGEGLGKGKSEQEVQERWPGEHEGTIRVDLSEWGGEGIHRHLLMVRWPEGWQATMDWWKYVRTYEEKVEKSGANSQGAK